MSGDVRYFLYVTNPCKLTRPGGPLSLPASSRDLNSLDFFFGWYIKSFIKVLSESRTEGHLFSIDKINLTRWIFERVGITHSTVVNCTMLQIAAMSLFLKQINVFIQRKFRCLLVCNSTLPSLLIVRCDQRLHYKYFLSIRVNTFLIL